MIEGGAGVELPAESGRVECGEDGVGDLASGGREPPETVSPPNPRAPRNTAKFIVTQVARRGQWEKVRGPRCPATFRPF
jgi:hypothetical protein